MRKLAFWFDYSCPYAYLGSMGVEALAARTGAALSFRPFLLGGVFRAVGTPQKLFATLSPAKAAHNAADLERWARLEAVPLRMPSGHPFRTVEALRATILTGCDPKVIHGFFRAYWDDNRPVSEEATMRDVLTRAGHDPQPILEKLDSAKQDLIERTDRALAAGVFGAPAYELDDGELFWGQDRVHFVEAQLTGQKCALPGAPRDARRAGRTVEVFFDFSSPFAYLGASQVKALAERTGATVVWKPILLGGLFRTIGQADVPLFTFSEAKQRYVARDLERWAAHWGVPYRFPSRFPMNTVRALRTYLALPASEQDAFRDAVFRAFWAEDQNIDDDGLLRALAGQDAVERAGSPDIKHALRTATDEAAARGVFGVPTFVVDGELFWGQDRLGLVEAALTG